MTISLAILWPGTRSLRNAADGQERACAVRARIGQELGMQDDLLWRLTTKPWARGRRAAERPDGLRLRDRLELVVTVMSMAGMAFATLACVVA